MRSSAIGEDSEGASFAGTHLSVLGVVGAAAVQDAVRRVHESAHDPAAIAYREQHGLDPAPRMAVVLQEMVASDVAGVLFTRHPVTGARERLIEASWGLGEMVVSGQVTPDQYRLSPDGVPLECTTGEKDIALRLGPDGRVEEQDVDPDLVEAPVPGRRPARRTCTASPRPVTWSSAWRTTTSSSPSPANDCSCCNDARSRMADPSGRPPPTRPAGWRVRCWQPR